jgi:hypothetical protein
MLDARECHPTVYSGEHCGEHHGRDIDERAAVQQHLPLHLKYLANMDAGEFVRHEKEHCHGFALPMLDSRLEKVKQIQTLLAGIMKSFIQNDFAMEIIAARLNDVKDKGVALEATEESLAAKKASLTAMVGLLTDENSDLDHLSKQLDTTGVKALDLGTEFTTKVEIMKNMNKGTPASEFIEAASQWHDKNIALLEELASRLHKQEGQTNKEQSLAEMSELPKILKSFLESLYPDLV